MLFSVAHQKIEQWFERTTPSVPMKFFGPSDEQGLFILNHWTRSGSFLAKKNIILTACSSDHCDSLYELCKKYAWEHQVIVIPGQEYGPHSGVVPSMFSHSREMGSLHQLAKGHHPVILILPYQSLFQKFPRPKFFLDNQITLSVTDILAPDALCGSLLGLGYSANASVEEPGTFAKKGEIVDVYPLSHPPIRITYFDEMIEKIVEIDPATGRSIPSNIVESLSIGPTPGIFAKREFARELRSRLPSPSMNEKAKVLKRKELVEHLENGILFPDIPYYVPLLVETAGIKEFFNENTLLFHFSSQISQENFSTSLDTFREQFELCISDSNEPNPYPDFSVFIDQSLFPHTIAQVELNEVEVLTDFNESVANSMTLPFQSFKNHFSTIVQKHLEKREFIAEALKMLQQEMSIRGQIVFVYQNESTRKEIEYFLDLLEFSSDLRARTHFYPGALHSGLYYPQEKLALLADSDFFSYKAKKAKTTSSRIDLFAEQMASLEIGDFVIHSTHGVGRYLGLEPMNLGSAQTDYLVIEYKGGDKVYLPIYKINLVQKHAPKESSIQPDSLRTNKFGVVKERAKTSAKELAFDLIKLEAERSSSQGFAFSPPDHEYFEFELAFPFEETQDQKEAIRGVLDAMTKPHPMDYLVCGDVGFGKTEVAMRAAYKAILDKKQVAVLVPTTVLALQHFHSFNKRFADFPVKIEFLSRFKSPKESAEIKERIKKGDVDIIIGTHMLLSKKISFLDLGLVVVDEEQRFGVAHKEQMKLMKGNVDFLTLTATPIPRTLQLSFLGLREMSLIKTAPPKRQSIKSYLIKQDDHTITTALEKELKRGGQVFIVHNRVNDIEEYSGHIRELVPHAKIVFAHGQMNEKELETRMRGFYEGEYQILISTTIIESGIDIPNANTMIIDRAHTYGLAQLHQLRGRIGRSERKAYAYFVIPSDRKISDIATQRLKALQTYAEMGSGFQIANCDLELRGAGDILGAKQSGHIEKVGLELYMELLKEAISELKGEKSLIRQDVEISTPFACYIPSHYIQDNSERMRLYKVLSNCDRVEELDSLEEELQDVYGIIPQELENLFLIIKARIFLTPLSMKKVQVAGQVIGIQFDKFALDSSATLKDSLINYFMRHPKKYQFGTDYRVVYHHPQNVSLSFLVGHAKEIAQHVLPG